MNKLSTESYKGVRDFYPEDKFVQEYIFGKMRKVVEAFGYEEYDASILEPTDLYRAKSGEELINEQVYNFEDRGGRDVTLRPEMTPTLARMVAKKKRDLGFPLRWYSIPNFFRYERPQKGRLREFWQLNADVFGVEGIEAEVEIITMSYKIMRELGAVEKDFIIKINDRDFINFFLTDFNLSEEEKYKVTKIFDRKNKTEVSKFENEIEEILGDKSNVFLNKISELENAEGKTPADIKNLMEKLEKAGITNVVFDPFLMRGLDYYTGIVFEVFDTNPDNNRAMFGGGRYDRLLEIFDGEKVPAFGFGMGDVTALEFLKSRDLIPEYISLTDLYLCILDEKYTEFTDDLAQALRAQDINVVVDYSYKKIDKQLKNADKKKVPFVICIGENEVKNDKFVLKRMVDGKEFEVSRGEIKTVIEKI
ncbi:histidine--tRNA ligase [Patescibacteria group bacterium]|nr:histidine--tRNA ligase [Patescibacteria group bacterium]